MSSFRHLVVGLDLVDARMAVMPSRRHCVISLLLCQPGAIWRRFLLPEAVKSCGALAGPFGKLVFHLKRPFSIPWDFSALPR